MTTFFYFQSLMWHTDIIEIKDNSFMKALKESNDKLHPDNETWFNAQYSWYGLERI